MLREMTSSAFAPSFKRFAQCAVAGLVLAGLAACGGGGSSTPTPSTPTPSTPTTTPPEIPVTPSGDSSISWTITDQCDDDADIELRFFQYSGQTAQPSLSWPARQAEGWAVFRASAPPPDGAFSLDCTSGQRVCYGAQSTIFDAENNPSSSWGVGIDGDGQQDDSYCTTCPVSGTKRQSSNLMCPPSPVVMLTPLPALNRLSSYAAIVYGIDGNRWGAGQASGESTRSEALTTARDRCEQDLGNIFDCEWDSTMLLAGGAPGSAVLYLSPDQRESAACYALAVAECSVSRCDLAVFSSGTLVAGGRGSTRTEAESDALSGCRDVRSNLGSVHDPCQIARNRSGNLVVVCDGPPQ